ncbi:glycosyltransferase family 9 protein [Arthrobacter sp. JSM 101049]|uniref:glycosyltransferase family 9 protein n=1 Tax=Arthrobacter sp. JSM 101049 TaxID=929097 RepID=UPI003564808E
MLPTAVGPVAEQFAAVERIAVLRGGGLGDLFFAMPAITALAETYPGAHITLLGTPIHAALLAGRPGPVDEVVVLPHAEGVRPRPADQEHDDAGEIARFQERMRARSFDLAVQVHGGGRYSNGFLLELGARHTIGTATEDAPQLERTVPYHYYQHEVLRALEVVGLAGAATTALAPVLEVTESDRAEARAATAAVGADPAAPWLVVHPGATDGRRKWPASSFAPLVGQAAADGYEVFLVGDESEAGLARQIRSLVGADAPDAAERVHVLAGSLGLGGLAGLLASCTVMVGNDSGPRHLAQAVGAPTVGIFWVGNLIMAAPFERSRHRVHLGWVTRCPQCGVDVTQVGWNAPRCEHVFPLTAEVDVAAVYADVQDLTHLSRKTATPAAG